jgi:peptidoglycan/LPS O-acetylase OafA/YrhL
MTEHNVLASVDLEHQDSAEVEAAVGGPSQPSRDIAHVNPAFAARIAPLDGLRGLAIASVFLHHAFHVKLLWMGVDLFFILSGFLITTILLKQKSKTFGAYIGHFYARRARRILPPYLVIMLITSLAFGTTWMHLWYFYLGGMNFLHPLHLFGLKTVPLWSLAVEEQFYLLWPLAVYFLRRKPLLATSWALLALAPVLRYTCTPLFDRPWAIYMLTPFRMDTLAAGALIAILWPSIQAGIAASPARTWKIGAGCMAVILLSLGAFTTFHRFGIDTYANTPLSNALLYETSLAICASVFLLALLGIGKRFLSTWPLVWLGRISYSIYLFHLTALTLLPEHKALPATLLTIAYALAMWYAIEMPNPLLSLSRWRKA